MTRPSHVSGARNPGSGIRGSGSPGIVTVVGVLAAMALGVWLWSTWWPSDERAIRRRLDRLVAAFNEPAPEGLGTVARAAEIGSYFTEDATIDLGAGSTPIHGRETVIGIAARFQPRAGGSTLDVDGVTVDVTDAGGLASVKLVAILSGRHDASGDRTTDARELQLGMTKADGEWRIARVTALDTLRRE